MKDYLLKPDWNSTRSIYRKLSDQFHVLTGPYSIEVNARLKQMLDHLILGIDEVDQVIDEIPTKKERDAITSSLLSFLREDANEWSYQNAPATLVSKMEILKQIVVELEVQERFCKAVQQIFHFTEIKRHTKSRDELINFVQLEGIATAELPLSILKVDAEHNFAKFFTKLCTLMGVADLIMDARSDYKAGYVAIKPNLRMYVRLNRLMVTSGLSLVWNFPKKLSFLIYCIQFSWLLITAKD